MNEFPTGINYEGMTQGELVIEVELLKSEIKRLMEQASIDKDFIEQYQAEASIAGNEIMGINVTKSFEDAIKTIDQQRKEIDRFTVEVERLRDPDWETYINLTESWLEKYPPDIFTGESGDSGPVFVVAIRAALYKLRETS